MIRKQKKESSVMNSINNVEKQDQRQITRKTDWRIFMINSKGKNMKEVRNSEDGELKSTEDSKSGKIGP